MTITPVLDNATGYNVTTDEAVILQEDVDWMKELIGNIRKKKDSRIIRDAEKDFHDEMLERYGGKVAGELLLRVWKHTKKEG